MNKSILLILGIISCLFLGVVGAHQAGPAKRDAGVATPLLAKELPDIKGKEVLMLTVEYKPGEVSKAHAHPGSHTFVYVLDGAVTMQVKGGELVTLKAGETFYENPDDIHLVSRNASETESAKFLVFFIKNIGAPSLVPVP